MNNDFMSAIGVLEFDPEQREANGKTVTQFQMTVHGQTRIRVTVWPELKVPEGVLKKGALVGVRGKYNVNESGGVTYHNLSALSIGVGEQVFTKEDAPVVKKETAAASEPAF